MGKMLRTGLGTQEALYTCLLLKLFQNHHLSFLLYETSLNPHPRNSLPSGAGTPLPVLPLAPQLLLLRLPHCLLSELHRVWVSHQLRVQGPSMTRQWLPSLHLGSHRLWWAGKGSSTLKIRYQCSLLEGKLEKQDCYRAHCWPPAPCSIRHRAAT